MTLKVENSCSIINFFDIQRVSAAIDEIQTALDKLDKELQSLRPKAGRTITHFDTGTSGFLTLPKSITSQALAQLELAKVRDSLDKLAVRLTKDTLGHETSFASRLDPLLEQMERMRGDYDAYLRPFN